MLSPGLPSLQLAASDYYTQNVRGLTALLDLDLLIVRYPELAQCLARSRYSNIYWWNHLLLWEHESQLSPSPLSPLSTFSSFQTLLLFNVQSYSRESEKSHRCFKNQSRNPSLTFLCLQTKLSLFFFLANFVRRASTLAPSISSVLPSWNLSSLISNFAALEITP